MNTLLILCPNTYQTHNVQTHPGIYEGSETKIRTINITKSHDKRVHIILTRRTITWVFQQGGKSIKDLDIRAGLTTVTVNFICNEFRKTFVLHSEHHH